MISPFLNDTTDGVVRFPSGFAMILLSVPSRTATAEFVVPKSIPIIFRHMFTSFYFNFIFNTLLVRSLTIAKLNNFLSFFHSLLVVSDKFYVVADWQFTSQILVTRLVVNYHHSRSKDTVMKL